MMVPHTTTGEWQSFEVRMRRRRAERLALRAEVAAEAGYLDDARAALDEARELLPTLPQLAAVEAVLSRPRRRAIVTRRRLTACVSVAATAAVVAVGISAMPDRPATVGSRSIAELSPAPIPAASVSPKLPASQPVVRVEPGPLAEVPAAPYPLPAVVARSGDVQPDALPAIALATPAVPPLVAVDPAPLPAIPPSSELPLLSELPSPEPPQEPLVRGALNRYASAFNALDAAAAQQVWPRVNRAALSRAFEGLASQQIALADCRIDVVATNATARCGGTATWAPKVGGGTRTEARDWHFELTRGQSGWQIVSATVQNR